MSIVLNMVGGSGGGGLKDTDAVITAITGAGSTVTATKGAVTLTPTMWVSSADNNLAYALFVVPSSMFDSNPWTVTASLGQKTSTKTVVVDSAKEYSLSLTYTIWLIKDGYWVDGVTWNLQGYSTATFVQTDNHLALYSASDVRQQSSLATTDNKYQLTGMSTVHIELNNYTGTRYGASRNTTTVPGLGVSTSTPTIASSSAAVTGWAKNVHFTVNSSAYITAGSYTLDVSELTGEHYVSMAVSGTSNMRGQLHIDDIWID